MSIPIGSSYREHTSTEPRVAEVAGGTDVTIRNRYNEVTDPLGIRIDLSDSDAPVERSRDLGHRRLDNPNGIAGAGKTIGAYEAVIFVHVMGVMAFLLVHGISVGVSLRLRKERDPQRARALLELSFASVGGTHMFMLVLIITGIVLGFMGGWWGMLWIWASLLLLVGMWAFMYAFGTAYYDEVRRAVGATPFYGKKKRPPMANPDPDRVNELLSSPRPILLSAVGIVGLAILFWLMMFKPF